jgi:hypothetical protein
VIFFGSSRLLFLPLFLFLLIPLLAYSPGLALLVVGVGAVVMVAGRRGVRRVDTAYELPPVHQASPEVFEDVRSTTQEDMLALADDIRSLDIDIEMPGVTAEAKAEYARALDSYSKASAAFDRANRPEDFGAVTAAIEAGRYAITATRARLEGKSPPQRRPPCFFDPRHGPSVRDVAWAPPGGSSRQVPACAADAIAVEEGHEPYTRRVQVGNRQVPYWNAPAYYGGWAGGFFSPFGILPGLLLGSALGAGMFALPFDGGYGGDAYEGDADGGDLGGQAAGAGDFGGGDFDGF